MSTTIDQKVVEMRFDNKQFESGVAETMSTLEKLKQGLKFQGAAKGLEEIDGAAKRCNLGVIGDAVHQVGLKFNAMYSIADQALRRITDSAMMYGKRIVSALTIDPIKMGFKEYETQINAVQTILANTESKGKTLDDVNGALDELNAYADKTIYNFTEMTRNIGTFTAAGVDLDTSVSAIKGIANLAAVSGSTSQQASTAMYQLSQALASGTVKLMDWNSVVNAGMGGQVFQDALKETARVHGVAIDDLIAKEGSFRETLSHGWLSSEILTETLSKFTGDLNAEQLRTMGYTEEQIQGIIKMGQTANDAATKVKTVSQLYDTLKEAAQSGWTQTWEILVGDFEEAKELLTKVSDTIGGMIGASAEARNSMLENWKEMGGRADVIESIGNVFKGLMSAIAPIKEAFREIFPPMTAEKLYEFTKGLKELTSKMVISDTAADNIRATFKGVFSVVGIVKDIFFAFGKAVFSVLKWLPKLIGVVLSLTGWIGDLASGFRDLLKRVNIFEVVFGGIATVINFVASKLAALFGIIKEEFVIPGLDKIGKLFSKLKIDMSGVGEALGAVKDKFVSAIGAINKSADGSPFLNFLKAVWSIMTTLGKGIAKVANAITGGLFDKLGDGNFILGLIEAAKGLISGGIGIGLIKMLSNLSGIFDNLKEAVDLKKDISGFFGGLKEIKDGVIDCFGAVQKQLKSKVLLRIAAAIAILAAALIALSFVDTDKISPALAAITILFGELMGSMKLFNGLSDNKELMEASKAMIAIGIAMLLLVAVFTKFSKMDTDEMTRGMSGVALLAGVMALSARILASKDKEVMKGVTQMIAFAVAINLLVSVVKSMAKMEWGDMGKGLAGLTALIALLVVSCRVLASKEKKIMKGITQMIALVLAVKILAGVCADLGGLDPGVLKQGIVGVAALMGLIVIVLGLIAAVSKTVDKSTGKAFAKIIGQITAIVAGIAILADTVTELGLLSPDVMKQGIVGVAALMACLTTMLGLLAVVSRIIGKTGKNATGMAIQVLAVSAAIQIMSGAVEKIGEMDRGKLEQGLVGVGLLIAGLAAMMLALAAASKIIGNVGQVVGLAAVLIVLTTCILALSAAMALMSNIGWNGVAVGLAAIGGVMLVLSIGLIAVAAAVKMMNGALAGAAAMLVVAVALSVLTPALIALGAAWLPAIIGIGAMAAAFVVIGAAGLLISPIIPGILALAAAFALVGVGVLALSVGLTGASAGLVAFGGAFAVAAPGIVAGLAVIISGIIGLIPLIIQELGNAIVTICQAIINAAPALAQAINAVLLALIEVVRTIIGPLLQCLGEVLVMLYAFLKEQFPQLVELGFTLLMQLLTGIANHIGEVVTVAADIIVNFLDGLGKELPRIVQAGFDLIVNFINGITNAVKSENGLARILTAAGELAGALIEGLVKGIFGGFGKIGQVMIDLGKKILDSIKNFLGIHSPSTKMKDIGSNTVQGFINGIGDKISGVVSKAKEVGKKALDGIKNKLAEFKTVGKDMMSGLANGIKDKISSVANAAKEVGSKALNGLKSFLGIKSPSRKFMEVGRYSDEGFAKGLSKFAGAVTKSATSVGDSALTSMKKSIQGISNAVETDIDSQPTIRPVLDLSDVRAGASAIGGMFGDASVGVMANVGSISSMMNSMNQNGGNSDVVSAIDKLRKELAGAGSTTYNVNGVTYDDGTSVSSAVNALVRAAKIERRR